MVRRTRREQVAADIHPAKLNEGEKRVKLK